MGRILHFPLRFFVLIVVKRAEHGDGVGSVAVDRSVEVALDGMGQEEGARVPERLKQAAGGTRRAETGSRERC